MIDQDKIHFSISFIASLMLHLAIGGYMIYDFKDELSISKDAQNSVSMEITFLQPSEQDTKKEAAATLNTPASTCQEDTAVVAQNEEEFIKNIVKKDAIKETTSKKKQKNTKKKIAEKQEKQDKKSSQSKKASVSSMNANNDVNKNGGNTSSGTNKDISNNNANLMGLIYAALSKSRTYPKSAKEREIEGSVIVSFRLKDVSNFEFIKIIKSSNSAILDRHAIKIVRSARRYFPPSSVGITITAPIVFNIDENKGEV